MPAKKNWQAHWMKLKYPHGVNNTDSEEDAENYQLFIGGCHPETQADDIQEYFSQFGPIKAYKLMVDKISDKFRGFAFLSYHIPRADEHNGKRKVLDYQEAQGKRHMIRGKAVQIKEALTKEESRQKLEEEKTRKLFCINLTEHILKEDLSNYFIRFGPIEDTRIITEMKKSKPKRFGFVLFKEKESMESALASAVVTAEQQDSEDSDSSSSDLENEDRIVSADLNKRTHEIKPGVVIEVKKTMLREELKHMQQEQARLNKDINADKRKDKRKEKKKRRKLKKKLEKQTEKVQKEQIKHQEILNLLNQSSLKSGGGKFNDPSSHGSFSLF